VLKRLWDYFSGMDWVGPVFFRSRKVWPVIVVGQSDRKGELMATLSTRDKELLRLMVQGKDDREIADELGISSIALSQRRKAVVRKMGARSPKEAIKRAKRRGLTR